MKSPANTKSLWRCPPQIKMLSTKLTKNVRAMLPLRLTSTTSGDGVSLREVDKRGPSQSQNLPSKQIRLRQGKPSHDRKDDSSWYCTRLDNQSAGKPRLVTGWFCRTIRHHADFQSPPRPAFRSSDEQGRRSSKGAQVGCLDKEVIELPAYEMAEISLFCRQTREGDKTGS